MRTEMKYNKIKYNKKVKYAEKGKIKRTKPQQQKLKKKNLNSEANTKAIAKAKPNVKRNKNKHGDCQCEQMKCKAMGRVCKSEKKVIESAHYCVCECVKSVESGECEV